MTAALRKQVAPPAADSLPLDSPPTPIVDAASHSPAAPRLSSLAFYLVHANMAFYAFAWWLCQPVLPFLSKELGADNLLFSYFQSFNMLVQFVGSPIIGRVIDTRGSKLALLVSHGVAALSYGLLSQATSIPLLFLSQVPTIFMAAMHSSQAYITLLTTPEERAKQIGRVSLSYGIGFILGPTVGGTLTKHISYSSIALIACLISIAVWLVVFTFLPDLQPLAKETAPESAAGAHSTDKPNGSLLAATRLLRLPSVRSIILLKLLFATALAIYRSSFSLQARDHFGLDAQQNGFILSGVGGLTMLVNVFCVGWLTSRFSERRIILSCIVTAGASLFLSAFAGSLHLLLALLLPMTIAGAVAATILTSTLTKLNSLTDAGSVLGLDMSIGTASRVIAPVIAGYLMLAGYEAVGVCAAVLAAAAWAVGHFGHDWGTAAKAPVANAAEVHAAKKEL